MRHRHLSKLTRNTTCIYLLALDSTNNIEMKELDVMAKQWNEEEDLQCFASWGLQQNMNVMEWRRRSGMLC